jgi:murein DD-endopeptidase MepM/ murein hydrolase activator NlpD
MNYTVKDGDTLSKIASRNGLTIEQLLDANPQLKADPNDIKVGSVINVPNGLSMAATQPLPVMSAAATAPQTSNDELGSLSAKYETGGRGPGTVSTGSGDPGGVSYGSYQMATRTGTVAQFVNQTSFPWRQNFANLTPGTAQFTAVWKQIAVSAPAAFQQAQHDFIERTHYDPLVAKIKAEDGLDVTTRSLALQNVVWSTAVQFGGGTEVVHRALANVTLTQSDPGFDAALIRAIYAERGRRRPDGKLAYFPNSSPGVQASVANRFKEEESDALSMLASET